MLTASGEEEHCGDRRRRRVGYSKMKSTLTAPPLLFGMKSAAAARRGHAREENGWGTMGTGCHSMVKDRLADASTNKTQDGQEVDVEVVNKKIAQVDGARVNLGLIEDLYKGRAIDAEGHGKGPIDGFSGRDTQ